MWWGRIQAGQLVHDLGTVPQDGVEFEEAVQRVLQAIQFLIGQSWRRAEGKLVTSSQLLAHSLYTNLSREREKKE